MWLTSNATTNENSVQFYHYLTNLDGIFFVQLVWSFMISPTIDWLISHEQYSIGHT